MDTNARESRIHTLMAEWPFLNQHDAELEVGYETILEEIAEEEAAKEANLR